jgi:hypothetical protein
MGIISQKLRDSAKGQQCTLQIAGVCCHDPQRTVLCHIGDETKGMGNKANDWSAAFGCDRCHEAIDHHKLRKADETFYVLRGLQRTWRHWIEKGLITIPVDPASAKRRPRKKANLPSRPMPARRDLWQARHREDQGD